jgi:prepilin peptidase CpaA
MLADFLVLGLLPLLLMLAACWDVASFTIPNFIPAALFLAFFAFAIASGMNAQAVGVHLLAGLLGLALGFGLFALGYIGGGDAKFFAATLVWLGFRDALDYALIASVLGGGLTLGLLSVRAMPLPAVLAGQPWIVRLHDRRSGVPYGVALAIGAFVVIPHTEVFRAAAGL